MDERDYERRKQVLDEQLEEGIELLRSSHRAQRNALDLVWMASPQNRKGVVLPFELPAGPRAAAEPVAAAPPSPPVSPIPIAKKRWRPGELREAIEAALEKVPREFTRTDLIAALGSEPDRGSLYRIVEELRQDGALELLEGGRGQYPSRYRKLE
jgi:hypothetical protein